MTEQAAKLKTAADEAHKATTKIETMNKRLTELVGDGAQDEQDRQAHLELRRQERQSHSARGGHSARGACDGASGQA